MNDDTLSRRQFLRRTSAGLAVACAAGGSAAASENPKPAPQGKTPTPTRSAAQGAAKTGETPPLKTYNIWDVHCHLNLFTGATVKEQVDDCLRFADRMGVERMCLLSASTVYGPGWGPEALRKENDVTIEAGKMAPDRFFGFAYMDPNYH